MLHLISSKFSRDVLSTHGLGFGRNSLIAQTPPSVIPPAIWLRLWGKQGSHKTPQGKVKPSYIVPILAQKGLLRKSVMDRRARVPKKMTESTHSPYLVTEWGTAVP